MLALGHLRPCLHQCRRRFLQGMLHYYLDQYEPSFHNQCIFKFYLSLRIYRCTCIIWDQTVPQTSWPPEEVQTHPFPQDHYCIITQKFAIH